LSAFLKYKFAVYARIPPLIVFFFCGCSEGRQQKGQESAMASDTSLFIRQPVVAGQFYDDRPAALKSEIQKYLDEADLFPQYHPLALIAPHAGYVYSGWIAGYSYKQAQGKSYSTVVVISPSHIEWFDYCSVMTKGAYRTPLGDIPIDEATAAEICRLSPKVEESMKGHFSQRGSRGEHALEVQLPFLQVALNNFQLVPIVMGDQSYDICLELGNALAEALKGKNALIVASSDLSHFHNYKEANRLDDNLIRMLETFQPETICDALAERKIEACGGGPIVAAMIAAQKLGAVGIKILKHANSGDVAYGTKEQVVGYLAAIMYSLAETDSENEQNAVSQLEPALTLEEKRQLMEIAKTTVNCVVKKQKVPEFTPISAALKENRGAFVTLKIAGELRGCIGYIIPVKPLYQTVREVAESAALQDPRFPPVSKDELPLLEYEISALSPVRRIYNVKEIEVGKHGIIIKKGYYQGLLLPQVAAEYGWDRETFLQHTCRKAGLPTDAWKQPGTEISIFSAEVFDESVFAQDLK